MTDSSGREPHPFLTGLAAGLPPRGFWESPVVVAVSGGADSVALFLGLVRLAPPTARLTVAHARHDLRPEAEADDRFVAALAARLGLPYVSRPLAVRDDPDRRGEGLEARARRLRYDFLLDEARLRAARHVVVGHTLDDQAETILHRILRGTGVAGLAGMRRARRLDDGIALVRPMLGLGRELVRGFLAAEAEAWREDPTNADPRFARNFVRHELLAAAARGPYPAAAAALARLGDQAERSAAVLESAALHLLELHARRQAGGRISLDAAALAALDVRLVEHVVAALWRREGWPRRDLSARHHATVAALIAAVGRGDRPVAPAVDLPAGVRARAAAPGRVEFTRVGRPSGAQ